MPGKPKGLPKTGGRKKGSQNKKTLEAKERVEWVLALLEPELEKDIKKLQPNERVRLWNDLQEYVRPKLARTELTGKDGNEIIIKVVRE
jgi:hypothetical protein